MQRENIRWHREGALHVQRPSLVRLSWETVVPRRRIELRTLRFSVREAGHSCALMRANFGFIAGNTCSCVVMSSHPVARLGNMLGNIGERIGARHKAV